MLGEFVKTYSNTHSIHGQTQYEYQFINKFYPNPIDFDISKFNIANVDIENVFQTNGINVDTADAPIIAITIKLFSEKNKFVTLGLTKYVDRTDNVLYVECKDEKELLTKFIKVFNALDIDILTGFHINGYDIPYLVNRINNVLGENEANKLSPLSKYSKRCIAPCKTDIGNNTYSIAGITIYDYLDLFKKFAETKLSSYSLNSVANHVLGELKTDYSEMNNLMDLYYGNVSQKFIKAEPKETDSEIVKLARVIDKLKDNLEKQDELSNTLKQMCLDKFYSYNIVDVELVEKLDNKQQLMLLAITLAYLTKSKHEDVFSPVRVWEAVLYNELSTQNIAIPPKQNHVVERVFEGAYVKEPIPGFYRWVLTMDYTSLYPMIMWQYNISPETQLTSATGNHVDDLVNMNFNTKFLKGNNSTILANGATFSREQQGVIPKLVTDFFSKRKFHKGNQLKIESEIEELKKQGKDYSALKAKSLVEFVTQMGFKILLNALYGSTGNIHFRYFSLDIAEGITLTGQSLIKYIEKQINLYLNETINDTNNTIDYVKLVDTDSNGIDVSIIADKNFPNNTYISTEVVDFLDNWAKTELEPFVAKKLQEYADYTNAYVNKMNMKREKICPAFLIRKKKNYIVLVSDNEGVRYTTPKFAATGIEIKRTSTPDFVKPILEQCYFVMLKHDKYNPKESELELQKIISDFKKVYMNSSIYDIAFPRGVSDIDKWEGKKSFSWITGTPIHVKASIVYNKALYETGLYKKYAYIKNGDKMKFVYLTTPNPYNNNAIGFVEELHSEFNIEKFVDKETQWQKSFLDPVKSLAELLNWDVESKNRLLGLLGDTNRNNQQKQVKTKEKVISKSKGLSGLIK